MSVIGRRLGQYLDGDPPLRRVGDSFSLVAALVWYLFSIVWLGHYYKTAAYESAGVLALFYFAIPAIYCYRPEWFEKRWASNKYTSHSRKRQWMLATAASVAALFVSGRRVEAAVWGARLGRLADQESFDTNEAIRILEAARQKNLLLPSYSVETVAARRISRAEAGAAVLEKVHLQAKSRGIDVEPVGLLFRKKNEIGALIVEGILPYITKMDPGRPNNAVPADLMAFIKPIEGGADIDHAKFGAAFVSMLGGNGLLHFPLDDRHFKNVIFNDCKLIYAGGRLRLENCGFANCTFDFARSAKCQALTEEILRSPSITTEI